MSITPLRLALIGLGGMGMTHLEIFAGLPHAQIAAVADSHALFADRAAAQIPTAAVFYDPLDCVNNADIDAVVVATTDDTHFDITQASIARGLHVLCEKPLTTTAHQSRQVVDAERATGRRLVQVGWMRRFDAGYQNLYSALRSGTVGQPVLISQRHRNPLSVIRFDERELITSSASHDIDIFRWLCGEDIRDIRGHQDQPGRCRRDRRPHSGLAVRGPGRDGARPRTWPVIRHWLRYRRQRRRARPSPRRTRHGLMIMPHNPTPRRGCNGLRRPTGPKTLRG